MTGRTKPTDTRIPQIETSIAKLEAVQRALHQALDEFAHDLRRAGDVLERSGGSAIETEQRQIQLKRNIRLTTTELRRNDSTLHTLRETLAETASASSPSD